MYEIYRKDKGGEFWSELKSRKHAGSRSTRNQHMDVERNDDDSTIITAYGPSYDSLIDGKGGNGWVSGLSGKLADLSKPKVSSKSLGDMFRPPSPGGTSVGSPGVGSPGSPGSAFSASSPSWSQR